MKIKRHFFSKTFVMFVFILSVMTISNVNGQNQNIKNDIFWNDNEGKPLNSQGGGIFKFPNPITGEIKYYWYGVHYEEANSYRNAPYITYPNATFHSVNCYSSTDLVNWKFEGDVITKDEVN